MDDNHNTHQIEKQDLVSLSQREALLQSIPGFVTWNLSEISELVSYMREVYFNAGEIIVREGDLVDSIYIIVNGSAEVSKKIDVKGKSGSTLLSVLNEGETIGLHEGRLFSATGLRTATVIANSDCLLLKINLIDFQNFLDKHTDLLASLKDSLKDAIKMHFIKQAEPFAELSNERIAWITPLVKEQTVEAGSLIFAENDLAENCYMLYEGTIDIFTTKPDGTTNILASLGPGAFFGESVLLQAGKRQASALAVTRCQLLILDREVLSELMAQEAMSLGVLNALLVQRKHPVRNEHVIYQHKKTSDGQTITILKDTVRNKYFQLNEKGWLIWQQLNGKRAVPEIAANLRDELGEDNQEFMLELINQLAKKGFVFFDIINMIETEQMQHDDNTGILSWLKKVYFIKHADQLSSYLYRLIGRFVVNPILVFLYLPVAISGFIFFIINYKGSLAVLPEQHYFLLTLVFSASFAMFCNLLNPLVKIMMIKRFKHDVPNIGLCWQIIGPTLTIDTSDLMLSPKRQQILVRLSGFLADLTVAGVLSLYGYYINFNMLLWVSTLFIYLNLLRSFDPFLNKDGYQFLSDSVDSFRLRELSLKWLSQLPEYFFKKEWSLKHTRLALIFWLCTLAYFLVNLTVFYLVIESLLYMIRPSSSLNLLLIGIITILYFIEIFVEYRKNMTIEHLLKQHNSYG